MDHYKSAAPPDKLVSITTNMSNVSRKTAILEPIPSARQTQKQRLPSLKSREQPSTRPTQKLSELKRPSMNQRRNKGSTIGQSEDAGGGPSMAVGKPPKQTGATRARQKTSTRGEGPDARSGPAEHGPEAGFKGKKSSHASLQKVSAQEGKSRAKAERTQDS